MTCELVIGFVVSRKAILINFVIIAVVLTSNVNLAYGTTSPFNFPESIVKTSPSEAKELTLEKGEYVEDFDISPLKPEVALIINRVSGKQKILFWKIDSNDQEPLCHSIEVPNDLTLSEIIWHPEGSTLFVLGKKKNQYEILQTPITSWSPTVLYHSSAPLRNLIIGPRPFEMEYDEKTKTLPMNYRLFFGVKRPNGTYSTNTVNEKGQREYRVINSDASQIHVANVADQPHVLIAADAIPQAFHPAGHFMVWEDASHCFQKAEYQGDNWGSTSNVVIEKSVCGGNLTYMPNGAALLHWQPKRDGVVLNSDQGKKTTVLARNIEFLSAPLPVSDGKGLVGVVQKGELISVNYVPINVPLADVTNAWMFIESPQDRKLLSENTGLFRSLENNQLYELYDSESYKCGGYAQSTPSRPYFVTSDIFLELYASAFEGIFVLSERQAAMPKFWKFVERANAELQTSPNTRMARAFAALIAVREGSHDNAEARKIINSADVSISSVTGHDFNFANLKPRGHYTRDKSLETYFRASKYLMDLKLSNEDREQLKNLPQAVIKDALAWINVYKSFIAPSKSPSLWGASKETPGYVLYPGKHETIFPLSWGIDNEILFSTVYHDNLPKALQIIGEQGPRLLPSGLDIAAVLGSSMAETILEEAGEFEKYPTLRSQLSSLKARYQDSKSVAQESLYQKWLSVLAVQWSDNFSSPGNVIQKKFWSRKRLQTALASWATLRHATLLVNERTEAECGEAGFEQIVLRPPRGYVEPDVKTLGEIANLFDATVNVVKAQKDTWADGKEHNGQGIWDGVIRRLVESRNKVKMFQEIAKKEIAGEELSTKEYENILYVGRAAEHNFLIFKSLAQKDFALSSPDPIEKVADVASEGPIDEYLLVGVGAPLEWDQIVPFFGRKEIVKGSIYSYYEIDSKQIMTDAEWRLRLKGLNHPSWIKPFISEDKLSCPAKSP